MSDVLEQVPEPFWWQRRWAALSGRGRGVAGVLVVVALLAGGALWARDVAAERELRERVVLAPTLGVWSSSTSPPGGAVGWFVLVRNDGRQPVTVTAVDAGGGRLEIAAGDVEQPIEPGEQVAVPVSVRLTCAGPDPGPLRARVGVRREDGELLTHGSDLGQASLAVDVATTLCSVRPALRDHELSGPVLRTGG